MISDEKLQEMIKKAIERVKGKTQEELYEEIKDLLPEYYQTIEDTLFHVDKFHDYIVDLLGTMKLPVFYEELEQDSVLDIKGESIKINKKYNDNILESAKCIAHEQRHYYQLCKTQLYPNDPQSIRFKEEFTNYKNVTFKDEVEKIIRYAYKEIEIDAFAFTQITIKDYYDIEIKHPDETYQRVIELYIQKYYK